MRLNQYLAACGLGSRRECEALIAAGRVQVNGAPGHFGSRIGLQDDVRLDGRPLRRAAPGAVWLLDKTPGVVSAARGAPCRTTVADLVRRAGIATRLLSIGRLDLNTTGLLLLTDDGDLAFALTHPSRGVEKEYEARVAAPLDADALERLRRGVLLEDGLTAA